MKSKGAIVLIGKAWMRAVWMQSLHQTIDESETVVSPLIEVAAKKPLRRKLLSSRLSRWQGLGCWINSLGDLIQ